MRDAYYNEFDPKTAAWLRVLIDQGHIARGIVDERSISDVTPGDLEGYIQCHFFAGIGVWSGALRDAGWPDNRPVWTGSCPCQPFSGAGKGLGFADERHLWPHWQWLIGQCEPDTIFGEQVSDKDGQAWFDLVSTDLEGSGYAVGAIIASAAGVGAPHQRHRLYFGAKRLADADDTGPQGRRGMPERAGERLVGPGRVATGGMADASGGRRGQATPHDAGRDERDGTQGVGARPDDGGDDHRPGPTNGFWRDADWLHGRDGKWRSARPGTFPLADGAPARVVRLRGYGNGLVRPHAAAFVRDFMEVTN